MAAINEQVMMVTGATAGIGKVTALELARQGATVVVVGRNPQKTEATVTEIIRATGNEKVTALLGDLSSQADTRKIAQAFLQQHDRLDVLVNNAGAIMFDRQESVDGIEMTWALNHLSYFLLTNLLLDAIKASDAGRVVSVSSMMHSWEKSLHFDDLEYTQRRYSSTGAYAHSKLANVVFTYELARQLQGTGVTANALHPGFVKSSFGRTNNDNPLLRTVLNAAYAFGISAEKGAETSLYLATSPDVANVTGRYFVNKKDTPSSKASHDQAAWARLWEISAAQTSL
jgi:retinol dehydrogenase-12